MPFDIIDDAIGVPGYGNTGTFKNPVGPPSPISVPKFNVPAPLNDISPPMTRISMFPELVSFTDDCLELLTSIFPSLSNSIFDISSPGSCSPSSEFSPL